MPGEKLEFTKQEPAFLRKLREQHGGPRNNVQAPRPKKDRLRTGDDDEDEPVILDESGENVAKEDWEGMLKREKDGEAADGVNEGDEGSEQKAGESTTNSANAGVREAQKVAEIGAAKKRKVGKVIGEQEGEDDSSGKRTSDAAKSTSEQSSKPQTGSITAKAKKKAKKIKLSFDEPD